MSERKFFVGVILLGLILSIANPDKIWAQKNKKKKETNKELSEKDLREAEYYFTEGQKYYILEDFAKSFVLFQKCLVIDNTSAAAHYKIAQILLKGDEIDKALVSINQSLKLEKNNKYYYLLAADLYTRQSDFERAAEIYEELIRNLPGTEEHYFDLAAIYLFQDDLDKAIEAYQKIEVRFGINEQSTFQKQKILLKQNKLEEAIAEGWKLIAAFPGDDTYVISLTEILISKEKFQQAAELLEEHLEKKPSNSHARLILSDAYWKLGKISESNENLLIAYKDPGLNVNMKVQLLSKYLNKLNDPNIRELAIKLGTLLVEVHPANAIARTTSGDIYLQSGSKLQAMEQYLESVKLDESNFVVWQNVLNLGMGLNQIDSVLIHSERALELFPNQKSLYYFNGLANFRKKRYDEAVFSLEQGRKLSSSDLKLKIIFSTLLGDAYNSLENHEKSDEAYESVLALDPNNYSVLNNYSYFLALRKEKLNLAKKMSVKLVKDHPDNPTYLDTHAWVLFMLKNYKEAKRIMERALKSDNVSGIHHEHYGDILYRLGDVDGAVEQWSKAKGLNSASELIDKKIADRKLHE